MVKKFKNIRCAAVLFFLSLAHFAFAQPSNNVTVTVNLFPPYSPYYSDYSGRNANKVLLVIHNNTATVKTIKLAGQLTGDNGIKISTKSNYTPLQPITLNPNETKQLNGLALKDIFDLNTLNVYGIDKSKLIYTSRLPEGNYSFCIQALDFNNGQAQSAGSPIGCSSITIAYPDAPVLLMPAAANVVPVSFPTNLVFSWMNNGFAPANTAYTLQVAEMPMTDADPNQILNSSSFPLINKKVNGFSYPVQPTDPPFKVGKRYAWRVIASDPSGEIIFKNNGISPAQQFRYGEEIKIASVFKLIKPIANVGVEKIDTLSFKWTFKDNSSLNDKGNMGSQLAFIGNNNVVTSNARYLLYIKRVQTEEEIKAEKNKNKFNASGSGGQITDKGVVVELNAESTDYKSFLPAVKSYLQPGNSYQWYLRHNATGTNSETRVFVFKKPKPTGDYVVNVSGRLRYNFKGNFESALGKIKQGFNTGKTPVLTEAEKGYDLTNKTIRFSQVRFLAKMLPVKETVEEMVNGSMVKRTEVTYVPQAVNDLLIYPTGKPTVYGAIFVATAQTDNEGNFSVNLPIGASKFKVVDPNAYTVGSGENKTTYALVDGIIGRVEDDRFTDPNFFIVPDRTKPNIILNEETLQIRDYKLNVNFATTYQRDFKGKLYLLKNADKMIKGEVDNLYAETKKVSVISTLLNKQLISYTGNVVGSLDVDFKAVNPASLYTFFNLVTELNSGENYSVYFEPEDAQNSLFFSIENVSRKTPAKGLHMLTDFKQSTLATLTTMGPKYINMRISGRYVYEWKDKGKAASNPRLPLPEGTKLTLMKGFISQEALLKDGSVLNDEKIIKSTTVGKNGQYSFNLGVLDYESFNKDGKDMVIVVDNKYYYSEPTSIPYNQEENIQLPEMVATVKQFKLETKLGYLVNNQIVPVKGLDVYLCRKKNIKLPVSYPNTDGDPQKNTYFKGVWTQPNGEQFEILDKTETGTDGMAYFNRLIMPILNDQEDMNKDYYVFAEPKSDSQYNYHTEAGYPVSGMTRVLSFLDLINSSKNYFKDNQVIKTFKFSTPAVYIKVVPMRPTIDGAVYPYSNTSTSVLSGVKIELYDMAGVEYTGDGLFSKIMYTIAIGKKAPERELINGANGRFLFDDFAYNNSSWKLLKLSKKGFISTYFPVNTGKPLKMGDRANLAKLYLDLPFNISAEVINDNKESVPARIIVGDDFSWTDTKRIGGYFNQASGEYSGAIETAYMTAPSGEVTLTIIPQNKVKYKTTTVKVNITNDGMVLKPLIVNRNTHAFLITCINTATGKPVEANVTLKNVTENYDIEKINFGYAGGIATLVTTRAAGNLFDLKVIPVDNLTIAHTQLRSDMTGVVTATVYVSPAATLNCKASYMENGIQIATSVFNVSVKNYNEDDYIVTKSASAYNISRLPLNAISSDMNKWITIVTGTKDGYIGQEQYVYLEGGTSYVNFKFQKLPANVPTSLYGFPIQITNYTPMSGGKFKVSGRLNPAGNASKSTLTPADYADLLTFDDVLINPASNVNIVESEVVFYEHKLNALLHKNYRVNIIDEQGLRILPEGSYGSLGGKVQLDPVSLAKGLKTSMSDFDDENYYLYLNPASAGYAPISASNKKTYATYMRTLSTGTSDMLNQPLLVTNSSRKRISFDVVDGLIVTPMENVMMTSSGMKFKGEIGTDLKYVNSANRNIAAQATFTIDYKGFSSSEEKPVSVGLNQWKLELQTWKLNQYGLKASQGYLNAQGLTIPFTNLPIKYDEIGFGNFDVKTLKLLNAFSVTLNASDVITSFGFDKGYSKTKGAWSVSILAKTSSSSLASLTGLPDLAAGDKIQINNINLYDTGNPSDTRILLMKDHPAVTLNNVSKFFPGTVSGGLDFISFKGALDLNVPNLSGLKTESYELIYKVLDGKFQHDTTSVFKNLTFDANGVIVKFKDAGQRFSNNVLYLPGVLTDKDKPGSYNINVALSKTTLYDGSINVAPLPGQTERVYMGEVNSGTYLDKVYGSMNVNNGVWNNFTFTGDLITPTGVDKKPMTLVVKGDIVASDAAVGVNNMGGGGISGLSLTYDFKEKALVGSCHIDQQTDFAFISADVDMYIGGSKWYVFTNGIAKNIQSSPINEAALGLMVGDAVPNANQIAILKTHFKSEPPPGFGEIVGNRIKGLFFMVSIDVPIPIIPQFDVPLDPVAHAELKHGIYGNFYFNANFSTKPEELSFGIGARLGGFVKVGAGASIGLACASISLMADIHADAYGKLAPWAKSGDKLLVGLGLTFTLNGSAYVGAGVCDSDCDTPCVDIGFTEVCSPIPCVKVGLSKGIQVSVNAELRETGFSLKTPTSIF